MRVCIMAGRRKNQLPVPGTLLCMKSDPMGIPAQGQKQKKMWYVCIVPTEDEHNQAREVFPKAVTKLNTPAKFLIRYESETLKQRAPGTDCEHVCERAHDPAKLRRHAVERLPLLVRMHTDFSG